MNSSENRSKQFPQYLYWLHEVGSFFVDQVVLLFSICVCACVCTRARACMVGGGGGGGGVCAVCRLSLQPVC